MAIMIPAMTGWIMKAKEKKYLLEARAVVMASQTVATEEYALGKFSGNGVTFLNEHKEEIFKLAMTSLEEFDTSGSDIRSIIFQEQDGKRIATLQKLEYRAKDGTIIIYDTEKNPIYRIGKEGGAPTYRDDWKDILEKIPTNKKNTGTMREAVKDAHNGTFPPLTPNEKDLFGDASDEIKMANGLNVDSLTWKPIAMKDADDGFAMVANTSDGSTNAYLVYYNGSYYACLNKHPYQGYVFDNNHVKDDMNVSDFDNAKDIAYYKEHLDEVTGKVWIKM